MSQVCKWVVIIAVLALISITGVMFVSPGTPNKTTEFSSAQNDAAPTAGDAESVSSSTGVSEGPDLKTATVLEVYKNPACRCCQKWITYLEDQGLEIQIHTPSDLHAIKQAHGLAPRHHSCHTAVTRQGYVFEGHVPVKHIQRFLQEKPEHTIGLSVPGMPAGSPGMETGQQFKPYRVLLLHDDGSSSVYADIRTAREQF